MQQHKPYGQVQDWLGAHSRTHTHHTMPRVSNAKYGCERPQQHLTKCSLVYQRVCPVRVDGSWVNGKDCCISNRKNDNQSLYDKEAFLWGKMRGGVCLSVFLSQWEKIDLSVWGHVFVCGHISGSLRVRIVLACLRWALWFVYEGQQEQGHIMRVPVGCVWGDGWPVAALDQAFSQLKVNAVLQLHWNNRNTLNIRDTKTVYYIEHRTTSRFTTAKA